MGNADDLYSPDLPEPIIHRIQSLLNPKKAAQTTLLSKSWGVAWLTRPTIDLYESIIPRDHSSYGEIDGFVKYVKKTFRRYEESNLRINTFTLCLKTDWYGLSGLATKWTLKALKLGATDLTFRLHSKIAIPIHEIFGSEDVVRLCLKRSIIGPLKVLNCRGLKSLTLSHVNISTHSFFEILSCCRLIENLSLSHIDSNIDDIEVEYEKHGLQKLKKLRKLKSLVMCFIRCEIQQLLLNGLQSKFPNLKELTLTLVSVDGGGEFREIKIIPSLSLEILNFGVGVEILQMVKFDVPGIRKFTFTGEYMPNLYFSSKMDRWEESHVSLTLTPHGELNTKWFFDLSNFLTKLRLSKIHLFLHHLPRKIIYRGDKKDIDYQWDEIEGFNVLHEVEDLTINSMSLPSLSFNGLLDGLFRMCRPKMISQYVSPPDDSDDKNSQDDNKSYGDSGNARKNDIFMCRAIEQVIKVKSLQLPTHFKHGLTDLDEVIPQKLFDDVWKPQPMDSILDDSASEQRRFRFLLKWKPSLN